MQLLSLTLKGFRGIRDGLGLNVLTLDFEALCDGAELVAIAGANGRGKTTVLDNMHPYLTMPSRASAAGTGGFSYYDHVFLPENEKDLVWALEGRSYRSQVVVRLNGRRRTEAFLFVLSDAGVWRPLTLEDGTVSDGKVETYTRCVEHLCGSADTFFTSVFGAQGRRQLSDYRNAEIKALLADLLGQEQIRELGRKAGDTAKLLKAGLVAVRQEAAAMDSEAGRLARAQADAADAAARADQAQAAVTAAALTLEEARQAYVQVTVQREQARETDARRAQLLGEREAAQAAGRTEMRELADREQDERQRLDRLTRRTAQRRAQAAQRRERLEDTQTRCHALLAREHLVGNAIRRLPLAERLLTLRDERVRHGRERMAEWEQAKGQVRVLVQRVQGIEREAGQAALQAQSLRRRLGLTAEVPCAGMPLQGACQLLADAREAQALIPSADAVLLRLADEKAEVERDGRAVKARIRSLAAAGGQLEAAERCLERARNRASRLAALRQQQNALAQRQATARRRARRIESAMGDWTLLARCMSNDGLIALAIDDAGPALSGLANDLLLACYGPRFTVSILTQVETAKGEKREDFDILVHDAESGESKSVRLMSGGERVWINECLVRAVALYLAQTSERHYETLFSDEADGALDPDRKRMFGVMKREVLRLGGYRREFFVSQTPELAGMADAVIDLEALLTDADPVSMA